MVRKAKVEAQTQQVEIQALVMKSLDVDIIGVSPFLSHKFSDYAIKKMEDKQNKKTVEKTARLPIEEEVEGCIHRRADGSVGYPVSAFKNGMREAAPYLEGVNMKLLGGVQVVSPDGDSLVKIDYDKMEIQKDIGRIEKKTPNIVYRPRFVGWRCKIRVIYNASQISAQQIVALVNLAGFNRGIGDWRPGAPKNPGSCGIYKVKSGIN
jgi:hypothetical protein